MVIGHVSVARSRGSVGGRSQGTLGGEGSTDPRVVAVRTPPELVPPLGDRQVRRRPSAGTARLQGHAAAAGRWR